MPTTNQMVCSCQRKTRTPTKESMRVIAARLTTKIMPRALKGNYYNDFIKRYSAYQCLNRFEIVLFHDGWWKRHSLNIDFAGEDKVIPALGNRGLRKIK
jgi:hypothetical protein